MMLKDVIDNVLGQNKTINSLLASDPSNNNQSRYRVASETSTNLLKQITQDKVQNINTSGIESATTVLHNTNSVANTLQSKNKLFDSSGGIHNNLDQIIPREDPIKRRMEIQKLIKEREGLDIGLQERQKTCKTNCLSF